MSELFVFPVLLCIKFLDMLLIYLFKNISVFEKILNLGYTRP